MMSTLVINVLTLLVAKSFSHMQATKVLSSKLFYYVIKSIKSTRKVIKQ